MFYVYIYIYTYVSAFSSCLNCCCFLAGLRASQIARQFKAAEPGRRKQAAQHVFCVCVVLVVSLICCFIAFSKQHNMCLQRRQTCGRRCGEPPNPRLQAWSVPILSHVCLSSLQEVRTVVIFGSTESVKVFVIIDIIYDVVYSPLNIRSIVRLISYHQLIIYRILKSVS